MLQKFIQYKVSLFSTIEQLKTQKDKVLGTAHPLRQHQITEIKDFFENAEKTLENNPNFVHLIQDIHDLIACLNEFPNEAHDILFYLAELEHENGLQKAVAQYTHSIFRTGITVGTFFGKENLLYATLGITARHAFKLFQQQSTNKLFELIKDPKDLSIVLGNIKNPGIVLHLIFTLPIANIKLIKENLPFSFTSVVSSFYLDGKSIMNVTSEIVAARKKIKLEELLDLLAIGEACNKFKEKLLAYLHDEKDLENLHNLMFYLQLVLISQTQLVNYNKRYEWNKKLDVLYQNIALILEKLSHVTDKQGNRILFDLIKAEMPFVVKSILFNIDYRLFFQILEKYEQNHLEFEISEKKLLKFEHYSRKTSAFLKTNLIELSSLQEGKLPGYTSDDEANKDDFRSSEGNESFHTADDNPELIEDDQIELDNIAQAGKGRSITPTEKNSVDEIHKLDQKLAYLNTFVIEQISNFLLGQNTPNHSANLQFDYLQKMNAILSALAVDNSMDLQEKAEFTDSICHFLIYLCAIETGAFSNYALAITQIIDTISPLKFTCTNMYQQFTQQILKRFDCNFEITADVQKIFFKYLEFRLEPMIIISTLQLGEKPLSAKTCQPTVKGEARTYYSFFSQWIEDTFTHQKKTALLQKKEGISFPS